MTVTVALRGPMTEPLTPLERRVYHYMIDFLAENTYQPSIREIAKKFRIKSTKTVSDLLHALANKGYIERDESRSRGVRLLGFASSGATQPVPFYGKVHIGDPALLPEHRVRYITLDRRYLPSEDVFLLKASGDGMTAKCISDGDLVMVSPSAKAKDGDLVAVRLGGESTVKMFSHRGTTIVLESADSSERPVEVGPRDDISILGVICGVFRPFYEREPVRETEEASAPQQLH